MVDVGRYKLSENESYTKRHNVKSLIIHKEYNNKTFVNDIAILDLETNVTFNEFVQPICLWNTDKYLVNTLGIVVGWGLNENQILSDILTQARMRIVDKQTCEDDHRDFAPLLKGNTLCAGDKNGTALCSGDSGGGMYLLVNGTFQLRGIVSVGEKALIKETCYSKGRILFTEVYKYLDWISNKTGLNVILQEDVRLDEVEVDGEVFNLRNALKLVNLPGCGETDIQYSYEKIENTPDIPWLAAIFINETTKCGNKEIKFLGNGVLISSNFVLSVASIFNQQHNNDVSFSYGNDWYVTNLTFCFSLLLQSRRKVYRILPNQLLAVSS